MATAQEPKPGDLIEIFRIGFEHWAVYVGDGFVIHVTSASDVAGGSASSFSSVPNKKAMVKKEKLTDVVGNNKWKISNKLDKKYKPRPTATILKEANESVGKRMEYSVLEKNCEHFANEMRYGKSESRQVLEGVSLGLLGLGLGAGMAAAASMAIVPKK